MEEERFGFEPINLFIKGRGLIFSESLTWLSEKGMPIFIFFRKYFHLFIVFLHGMSEMWWAPICILPTYVVQLPLPPPELPPPQSYLRPRRCALPWCCPLPWLCPPPRCHPAPYRLPFPWLLAARSSSMTLSPGALRPLLPGAPHRHSPWLHPPSSYIPLLPWYSEWSRVGSRWTSSSKVGFWPRAGRPLWNTLSLVLTIGLPPSECSWRPSWSVMSLFWVYSKTFP